MMNVMVLGSGLMGPAAAYNALCDEKVMQVFLCDKDAAALEAAQTKLARLTDVNRLKPVALDLDDQARTAEMMRQCDVILAALPSAAIPAGIRVAASVGTPWVDLSWPAAEHLEELNAALTANKTLALFGCGVEPGLTEIMAVHLARRFDQVDELHIKCGGIPAKPSGPLNYRIVFGGARLPLRATDGHCVEDGALKVAPRYTDVETFHVEGVGVVEAWHENFMPWLLEQKRLSRLRRGTQKTVRWPGYGDKARTLKELGLLDITPVKVGDVEVAPKAVVDAVLYPHVRMLEDDRDITILRVDLVGRRKERPRRGRIEMVDRFDETTGFTSMARTTAFTGMIIARMVGRGDIKGSGIQTPEKVVVGKRFNRLVKELAANGVFFHLTQEKTNALT